MGAVDRAKNNASLFLKSLLSLERLREKGREVRQKVLRPKFTEKWTQGDEDRLMQVLALFLVPVVVIVSLVCIVALNQIMSDLFGVSDYDDSNQSGLVAWFITGVTGGMLVLAAWVWFQWVRTYGFGIFRWN